jgi:DNA polymerase-1
MDTDYQASLSRLGFRGAWAMDFEFVAPPGEKPTAVCMVAKCALTGETIRLWGDELAACPFSGGNDELFVAYYASAEASCFDALGWPRPRRMLDLFTEFRRMTNGVAPPYGNGLLGALLYFGLPGIGGEEKTGMRELVMTGGPWTHAQQQEILDYCESDVDALLALMERLFP